MDILKKLREVMSEEASATQKLSESVTEDFEKVVRLILQTEGKVIISGVGKSGLIGQKMAATFASTGTPAFFIHSTESLHGDLGMIEEKDIVILISNSGETSEVLSMIPSLNKIKCKKIAITSKLDSSLAQSCDYLLSYNYDTEADHLNLAPTTSAMLTLIIGDALAVTVSKLKEFEKEEFHLFHPGGNLGSQLSKNK